MKLLLCLSLMTSALAQIPGEMESLSVRVGLLRRSYSLYVPSTWTPDQPVPLVLNYHGLTDTPEYQAEQSKANEYAEMYGWAVAYPSGTGRSHNGGVCCPVAATLRTNDVGFARALIDDVSRRMPIRSDGIFSIGFSNGGFMTERLACEASDVLAAVGSHSGRKAFGSDFNECNPVRPIPVISIQGTLDLLVPYLGNPLINFPSFSQDLASMQTDMRCNPDEIPQTKNVTSTSTCQLYTDCTVPGVFIEYCTVRGGDHSWFTAPNIDSTGYIFMRFAEILGVPPVQQPFLNFPPVTPHLPERLV